MFAKLPEYPHSGLGAAFAVAGKRSAAILQLYAVFWSDMWYIWDFVYPTKRLSADGCAMSKLSVLCVPPRENLSQYIGIEAKSIHKLSVWLPNPGALIQPAPLPARVVGPDLACYACSIAARRAGGNASS